MNNEKNITLLNGLIETSRDSAEGFKTCADNTSDSDLKMYFHDRAKSCEEAVNISSVEVIHYAAIQIRMALLQAFCTVLGLTLRRRLPRRIILPYWKSVKLEKQ